MVGGLVIRGGNRDGHGGAWAGDSVPCTDTVCRAGNPPAMPFFGRIDADVPAHPENPATGPFSTLSPPARHCRCCFRTPVIVNPRPPIFGHP